nr:RNA-directed DNA polymerase, eukaryota, reverse transcriptase zinc-binding domain protein [Tanacetum cinerariifolium]
MLLEACRSLEYLDVRSCPHVTKAGCDEAGLRFPESCKSRICFLEHNKPVNQLNISVLVKWWWRLYTDRNALWFQVIVSIHGLNLGIDLEETSLNQLPPSPWKNILSLNRNLLKTNIDLHVIFKKKVGNGSIFRFWGDIWFGGDCLKTTFARLYSLESNKQCLINERCSLLNGYIHFTWAWRRNLRSGQELDQLDTLMGLLQHHCPSIDDRWDFTLHHSNMFSLSVMRKYIDSRSLLTKGNKTKWNKLVPIKINILAWRLINDRLSTRSNLDSHGIDLHSLLCPWKVDNVPNTLLDLITWVDSANLPDVAKNILDGVILTTVWKSAWSLGPKIIEIMKHKLSHGAKIIQYGGQERVAFCSDRSIKTYSMTGDQLKFQYKVSIPLVKIKGLLESKNMKRPSNNYVELVTVDDFSFWFMGFMSIKKTLRYLHQAAGTDYLST